MGGAAAAEADCVLPAAAPGAAVVMDVRLRCGARVWVLLLLLGFCRLWPLVLAAAAACAGVVSATAAGAADGDTGALVGLIELVTACRKAVWRVTCMQTYMLLG